MAVINLQNIPDKLRNDFKAACAAQGETMKYVLMRLMKEEVERQKKR